MSKTAIEVDNVSMKFNLSREKVDSLKDYIFKTIKREIQYNEFWALKNVSFSVEKGDRVGILGLNGAGKSTLLKVISGVFKPTEGHVDKHGKWFPFWNLALVLTRSIQEKRIFTCMVPCLDIPRNLLTANMMRL